MAPAIGILVLTQLMFVVDTSIVNVALPDIGEALGLSSASLSWVVTAYALAFGGLILLSGKVGAMIGRRRALVLGVMIFVVASLIGGFSPTASLLVAARALQGVGAALAAPSVMVLLMGITVQGPQRSRAMAMFVLAGGAGAAIGLFTGGLLTQTLGWRWVMFVTVPIGALAVLGALRFLPETDRQRTPLDIGGGTTSIIAMASLVFGFTAAADHGWAHPQTLGAFAVAGASLVALVAFERRHPHPVLPLELFARIRSASPLLTMLFVPAGQVGFLFFTTLLTQRVLGFTPIQTGLALVPFTLGLLVTSQIAPRLLPRWGERIVGTVGLTGLVLAIAWMSLVATNAHPGTSIIPLLLPAVLLGAGAGATLAQVTAVIMHQIPEEHRGAAASLNQGLPQLGGAMGLAVLTSILTATGGLTHGLGTTILATAAFPFAGLVLFGVWGRRIPAPNTTLSERNAE